MIEINDGDSAITVAEKLINGTKPYNPTQVMKAITKVIIGEEPPKTVDMFSVEEIKEIADYLIVYYEAHNGKDEEE